MKMEFKDTPDIPPASALEVIRNRKVTHADGKKLEHPFSMHEVLNDQTTKDATIQAPATDADPNPPAPPADAPPDGDTPPVTPAATPAEGEGDGDEQQLPKSRFDQVNVRMHTAEADLAAEKSATAALRTELAESKRESALTALRDGTDRPKGFEDMDAGQQQVWLAERVSTIQRESEVAAAPPPTNEAELRQVVDMAKEQGFTLEQAELVDSLRKELGKSTTLQEATAIARMRQPGLFQSNGSPPDHSAVPTSHASQPPRSTGTQKVPVEDPAKVAAAMPQATGDQRDAKAMQTIRAIRARKRP